MATLTVRFTGEDLKSAIDRAEAQSREAADQYIREHFARLRSDVFASLPALSASYHLSEIRSRRS